ncbi:Plasmodium exported protein, unknown function [Plasmodium relictum]|uniref:Uncharacterized protein n=1 Tax=Plasmodium relictum TaxID=85471 RepID=A0A1J1HDM2_PLARL|nr:Plasmodium exported protein, unknown function [Plasmodium relictum]CRH03645.1 Plasmodium exported protein, unknown function [Plasmodium relictum]
MCLELKWFFIKSVKKFSFGYYCAVGNVNALTLFDQGISFPCVRELVSKFNQKAGQSTNMQNKPIPEKKGEGTTSKSSLKSIKLTPGEQETCFSSSSNQAEESSNRESELAGGGSKLVEFKDPESCKGYKLMDLLNDAFHGDITEDKDIMMRCLGGIYVYVHNNSLVYAKRANLIYTNLANSFLKLHFKGKNEERISILRKNNDLSDTKDYNLELFKKMLKKVCAKKDIVLLEKAELVKAESILEKYNSIISDYTISLSTVVANVRKLAENYQNYKLDLRFFNYKYFMELLETDKLGKIINFLSSLSSDSQSKYIKIDISILRGLNSNLNVIRRLINNVQSAFNLTKKKLFDIFKMKGNFNILLLKDFLLWYFDKYDYKNKIEEISYLLEDGNLGPVIKKNLMKILHENEESFKKFKEKFNLDGVFRASIRTSRLCLKNNKEELELQSKWNDAALLLEKLVVINKVSQFLLDFREILSLLNVNFLKLKCIKSPEKKKEFFDNIDIAFKKYDEQKKKLKMYTQWFLIISRINEKLENLESFLLENQYIESVLKEIYEQCNFSYITCNSDEKMQHKRSKIVYFSINFVLEHLLNNKGIFLKDLE